MPQGRSYLPLLLLLLPLVTSPDAGAAGRALEPLIGRLPPAGADAFPPPPAPVSGRRQGGWDPATAPLVYTSRAPGNPELLYRAGPGTDPVNLTAHEAADHWASWSPDGVWIAFQTLRDGQFEVYVMSADGSSPRNLTRNPANDLLPEFGPDGRAILFFSDEGVERGPEGQLRGHLYLMAVSPDVGSDPAAGFQRGRQASADAARGAGAVRRTWAGPPAERRRLTEEPLTSTFGGTWSPDGTRVLFARDYDGDIDLVLLDLETGEERRVPGTAAAEYGGRFSPDGRWIGFTGAPPGETQFDLFFVPAEGGEVRPLVLTGDDERSGAWRPVPPARDRRPPPPRPWSAPCTRGEAGMWHDSLVPTSIS